MSVSFELDMKAGYDRMNLAFYYDQIDIFMQQSPWASYWIQVIFGSDIEHGIWNKDYVKLRHILCYLVTSANS